MGAQQTYRSFGGGQRIPGRHRASHRRLQRMHLLGNWTPAMWFLLAALLGVGVLMVTGVITHPPHPNVPGRFP